MQTYELVVTEDDSHAGLDVEVRGADDLIVASTRLDYEDYGEEALREDDYDGETWTAEATADVERVDVEVETDGSGFTVTLVGDDEPLERIYVSRQDLEIGG
ncbi:hypothetical protein GCM10009039_08550 [Halocalculus aciditolerans]|uniref:Uncharacterized protein n=2 Tax=Halocalculus aciditolerans TaxID=1383812 RepID=A0A830FGD5_9EURY|nr:hypothetical protein GCM10009039_08550 [Halocalculus aciditolerans]